MRPSHGCGPAIGPLECQTTGAVRETWNGQACVNKVVKSGRYGLASNSLRKLRPHQGTVEEPDAAERVEPRPSEEEANLVPADLRKQSGRLCQQRQSNPAPATQGRLGCSSPTPAPPPSVALAESAA